MLKCVLIECREKTRKVNFFPKRRLQIIIRYQIIYTEVGIL